MKRISFIFALISLLTIPTLVLAVYRVSQTGDIYERLPDGEEITSPIRINFTYNKEGAYYTANCGVANGREYITIYLTDWEEWEWYSELQPIAETTNNFILPFEVGTFSQEVFVYCTNETNTDRSGIQNFDYEACGTSTNLTPEISLDDECLDPVFTIIEGSNILPVSNQFVLNALAYVGDVWSDFHLIVLFGMGLPISFYIVKKVIAVF